MMSSLTQVSMTRSTPTQTRTFVYDPTTQRLTSATHPESGTVSYTYNSDGTVATRIDAKNQKTAYVYDTYKRVTQIQHFPVSTGPEDTCQRQIFSYDTNPYNSGYSQNAWGRLTAVTWQSAGCTKSFHEMYSYTPVGLVMKKRLGLSTADCGYMEATLGYNGEGTLIGVNYPRESDVAGGTFENYQHLFDSLGRPNKLQGNFSYPTPVWEDRVKDVAYGPADELTQHSYYSVPGFFKVEGRTYNSRLQLTRLTMNGAYGSNVDLEYRYSATQNNGQITQSKDWITGEEVTHTYDALNRLIASSTTDPSWGLSFGYDGFGNRLSQTLTKGSGPTVSLSVNAASNRINSTGYAYDANGNLTTMPNGGSSRTLSY